MKTTSLSNCQKGCVTTKCQQYRLLLSRFIDETSHKGGVVGWVLNNPSVADHETDDPTIRRLWTYTQAWGFESMAVVNTNPYRSTNPNHGHVPSEHVLQRNDHWLEQLMQFSRVVVCGWGDKANPDLAKRAALLLHKLGPLHALRVTKAGNPQHPLYLHSSFKPNPWVPTKWLQ